MKHIYNIQHSFMLLFLLIVEWATGCPLSADTNAAITDRCQPRASVTGYGISSIAADDVTKHVLNIKIPNKNGIRYIYYSSDTEYGRWQENTPIYITEGCNVYIEYKLNTSYTCKSITLNGIVQNISNYLNFEMPSSDVEIVIDTEFDPSSPSDPQPADTTKYYNLSLVGNPSGAGTIKGYGKYTAGSEVYIRAYSNSGYVFTGWTKDGDTISTNTNVYYTMPASDVVLTANYVYNPSSPSEPEQPILKHPLTVIASPAGSGSFSSTGSEVTYGEEYYVYAYPETGYKFKGWIVNGEAQEDASIPLRGTMTDAGASVVGLFVFDPSSPANPGANYYNPTTGQAIIDDFTSGKLYSALSNAVGYDNFENVNSLIVKGRLESGDYGSLSYLSNAGTIDLSRTGGTTGVPSYAFQNLAVANILLSSEITTIGNYAFRNCTNLTSLTVYAQVPPTCSSSTFSNFTNKDNCTVYVPSSAIELYAAADYWKDFTILPINTDAHILQVNLPADASDGRYKYNSLEIVNINSGVRQKYVISDRLLYTFNGLRKDEQYNIYMYSQTGLEIGRIENVVIPEQDIEVTFDNLKPLHTVSAKVLSADGSDVTSQVTVEWLKPLADGTIVYLRKANSLGEVPDGQQLICRVSLDNNLGTVYQNPDDVEFTVSEERNICTVTLVPFRTIALSGTVVDGDGVALSGASVSVNQVLNSKYSKTFTSKTDRSGFWTVEVLDAPETYLTYAASECVNVNDTIGAFAADVSALDMGKTTLKSIVGARITYGFTYHAAGVDEVETYYSDYQNVAVSVFNVTQNRPHNEISLQYPLLAVLDENINEGDELRLTATSKNGAFNAIEQTVTIDGNQRAEVTFDIVGKGGLSASFETTDNPEVIAMLYSSKGELLKKTTYSEAAAMFTELEDGEYTLITMGQSDLMNSVLRLSSFTEIGLTEGKDYVMNTVTVESGKLTEVKNAEIPAFDESLFYYTNSSTSFSSNKSSITTGNYLTLRSAIDFKGVYKEGISNVALVVDLPETCDFVEQSVIQGPNLLPYTIDNNRLTVQLGNNYNSQVRFCVVPTAGGAFNATASVVFDYGGKKIKQPIGSAVSEIKNLEIMVPSVINGIEFTVSGVGPSHSKVQIYGDGTIIGQGNVLANGTFSIDCELNEPYNLSEHEVYASIITSSENVLKSETKSLRYDVNAVKVKKITMTEGSNRVVFDFENPDSENKYYYYSFGKFTFLIEFNSPKLVKEVMLYVHTTSGAVVPFIAEYDSNKDAWFVSAEFSTNSLPLNVSVDFNSVKDFKFDAMEYTQLYAGKSAEILSNLSDARSQIEVISDTTNNKAQITESKITVISDAVQYLADDDNLNNDDYEEVLAKLLTVADPDFDISDLEINIPEEYSDAEIDELLLKGEGFLKGNEYSNESTLKLNTEIDNLLESIEAECNYDSSLEFDLYETLEFEYQGEKYSCMQIPFEEFKHLDVSGYNVDTLKLTDNKNLMIYVSEKFWMLCNESSETVFRIETTQAGLAKIRMASGNDIGFLENLKQEFNVANQKLIGIISDATETFRNDIKRLKSLITDAESEAMILLGKSASKGNRVKEIECQLKELAVARKGGYRQMDLIAQEIALKNERKELLRQIEQIYEDLAPIEKKVGSLKVKLVAANALLAEVLDFWQIVDGAGCIIKYISTAISDCIRWNAFIETILPCPSDIVNATNLKNLSESNRNSALSGYTGAFALASISEAISIATKVTAKPAGWALKFLLGSISGACLETSKSLYSKVRNSSLANLNSRIADRSKLKCKKTKDPFSDPYFDPEDPADPNNDQKPNPRGGRHHSGNTDSKYGIDPSGYVYEAVPENRIEGVQATIYYKETKEDKYGDPYEEIILWNAEEYTQKNPLFTDEKGMYSWDVPQGLWRVKFEKEGYVTTYSEWLPVPPPQLEVNIGITQNKQPEVIEARAYEEGVEVLFDKFMDLSTLTTDNIYVTANGEKLNGEVHFIDSSLADEYASEDDPDATRYASRIRFVPETPLSVTTGEIRVTVSRNVQSYAGIPMTETFSQVLDVEKEVQAISASDVKVLYGGEKEITIYVAPYEAAVGRTLHIANSSSLIASVATDKIILDDEGKAVVTVKGELPGCAQLTFTIDDVTVTGTCAVDVVTEIITAEAPKASRASGTAVYRGTKIELTTDSKDATIYFTTDGSCPCDENGTRRKYTVPIIIDEDTRILAMTSVGTGDEDVSETVEFNYTLKRSDMDFQMEEGWTWISHNFESGVSPSVLASDESVSRILSQTQELIRDPQLGLVGTLTEMTAPESYKVETTAAAARQRLSDVAWNPATPISLNAGWNWLGYPVGQTMSVNEAFATTDVETLDVIVGQNGFAQFDGEKWIGTLETMSPGMGYMYQSQSEKNVVYNTSIVSTAAARYVAGISNNLPLVLDIHKYGDIMPVVATINSINGSSLKNEDYQVAAFCGTECRGIGRIINGLIMMNVYGNTNDNITFQVTDAAGEKIFINNVSLSFSEKVVGNILNPYIITIDDATGIANVEYSGNVKVSVIGDMLKIEGIDSGDIDLVEIYDINGHRIVRKTNVSESGIRISTLTTGVYVVVVNGNGEYTYHKVLIR